MHGIATAIESTFSKALGYGALSSDLSGINEVVRGAEIRIASLKDKGNCVLSCSEIDSGQCIVTAPAYRLSEKDLRTLKHCDLYKYVFYDDERRAMNSAGADGFMVFGALSFCSHSSKPNAKVVWLYGTKSVLVKLIALIPISSGEEITMHYSNLEEYEDAYIWI